MLYRRVHYFRHIMEFTIIMILLLGLGGYGIYHHYQYTVPRTEQTAKLHNDKIHQRMQMTPAQKQQTQQRIQVKKQQAKQKAQQGKAKAIRMVKRCGLTLFILFIAIMFVANQ